MLLLGGYQRQEALQMWGKIMDVLLAEGIGYLEDDFKEAGFIPHGGYWNVFALHTTEKWPAVLNLIKNRWGYFRFFRSAKILKTTTMKNGKTNFVFKLI